MGLAQGTVQPTAQAPTIRRTADERTICWLCLDRFQRERHSVCTCNHCSLPLCSDCMRDHIDELPKSIAQLSGQLHQLQDTFQSKQNMVDDEVSKSKTEIKQCFKTYQSDLFEAHEATIAELDKTKQDAKQYLERINSELHTVEADINALARETIFQPTRIEALLNQLNRIQEKLQTYTMTKDSQMQIVLPKYSLKFQCNPPQTTVTNDANRSSTAESSNTPVTTATRSGRRFHSHPYRKPSCTGQRNHRLPENTEPDHY